MFEGVKAVLLDLDGTVYHGSDAIPGAMGAVEHCRNLGKRVFFVTNNSARTRVQVRDKLWGLGIACEADEVVTSGYVCALHALWHDVARLYVCGTEDLKAELAGMGVDCCGADDAENIVVGYDPAFNYGKLARAVRVAKRARVFVACNRERVFRGQDAQLFPGCGAMVAAVEWSADRQADFVVGKPNPLMLEVLCREHGLGKDEVLVVGDTRESDIAMADGFGCASVLVGDRRTGTACVDRIGDLAGLLGGGDE